MEVDSIDCLKCGKCCEFFKLPITIKRKDLKRWLNLRWSVEIIGDHIYVFNKCSKLLPNRTCAIYKKRPLVCRNFKVGSKDCIEARGF